MKRTIFFLIILVSSIFLTATTTQNEVQKLLASDGGYGDNLGKAVSIDGNFAIVGAPFDSDNGSSSGSAYIYHYNGSNWVELQKLIASDGADSDYFGYSVSISGDYAIVGAYGDDDHGSSSGSAYIYHYNGSNWIEQQKITASNGADGSFFGYTVSISGNNAIVGALLHDVIYGREGSVYIFHFDGSNWIEQQILISSDAFLKDYFGCSVSIDGDKAIVGSWGNNYVGNNDGSAYIYTLNGSVWVEQQKLIASDAYPEDRFGGSVSISGDYAIVGSHWDDDNGSSSGSAYIYHYNGSNWVELQKLIASDGAYSDYFGYSVSISGYYAIVGAYGDDDNGSSSGSAYIYYLNGTTWEEQRKILASDASLVDNFGSSVFIFDNTVFVGAPCVDDNGTNSGSLYIFEIENYVPAPSTQQEVVSADDTSEIPFNDVDASLRFTGSHVETTVDMIMNFQEPDVVGGLPTGIINLAGNYWQVISSAGNVGTYDITFDLSGVSGIENFATLKILKRDDDTSPWQDVVADLGATLVYNYPYITIQGLSSFSEFVPAGGDDNSLPVTLSSFNAVHTSGCRVQLTWSTASETEMNGFNVFRNSRNEEINAELVNSSIIRSNNVASGSEYNFCDIDVDHSSTYYYWLESVSLNGSSNIYGPVCVTISEEKDKETPQEFTNLGIKGIYPNPFNPETNIDYSVKEDTPVVISVFNLKGQKVKTLVDKTVFAGDHKIIWQGDSDSGSSVSSGVYFVKMITGNHIETRKIVLMK